MRTLRPALATTALTAAILLASSAGAQQSTKLDVQDRHFAEKAMAGGMMEVEAGKMAQERAANPEVKRFGQRMVDDHSKANETLIGIAKANGLEPPKKLPSEEQKSMDKLSGLKGDAFDSAYMTTMVEDHKQDIKDFQKQAQDGKNAELKNFAQQTLPTLKQHLDQAQSIQHPQGASSDQR